MAKHFLYTFGVSGDLTAVPDAAQPDGTVSYYSGYPAFYGLDKSTDPSALDIERAKMNNLFNDITGGIQDFQHFSYPTFITAAENGGVDFPYSEFVRVFYDDGSGRKVYESLKDANTDLPTVTASWTPVSALSGGYLEITNNLSDLDDASTARTNLGLGTLAVKSVPYFAKAVMTNLGATNPSVLSGYNIASVVRNGVGNYTVNFTDDASNTNYVVSGNVYMSSHPDMFIANVVPSLSGFTFLAKTSDNAVFDPDRIAFNVFE